MKWNGVTVGVDVGGLRKGFHGVVLRNGAFQEKYHSTDPDEMTDWCRKIGAEAIAVDSPCAWSKSGKSRHCEREMNAQGIKCHYTPSRCVAQIRPWNAWMSNGAELYRKLSLHYPLHLGKLPSGPFCLETYPHAAVCALNGTIHSAKNKRQDRLRILRLAGIQTTKLTSQDDIDAALCAFVALAVLNQGARTFGDRQEGLIFVPTAPLYPGEKPAPRKSVVAFVASLARRLQRFSR